MEESKHEKFFSRFLKNKDKYDLTWREKINDESSLERELENEKNNLENDKINFENEISFFKKTDLEKDFIETDKYNKLIDLLFNENTINNMTDTFFYCYPNKENSTIFKILRCADIITKIYLELKFDSLFEDIPLSDKLNLLDGTVTLVIGEVQIISSTILTCIFNAICTGHNIKCNNNIIQIPLFIFNTLIDKYNIYGLPLISLFCHKVEIDIILKNKIKHMTSKLLINGIFLEEKKQIIDHTHEFIIFQNIIYKKKIRDYTQKLLIKYFYTKFILVYFTPIDNTDDLFIEYPEIIEASLTSNKNILPIISWDSDNILSFEIFGIKIYGLPLSKDMSTWEKIQESLTNPLEKMILNNMYSKYHDYECLLNIENTPSDNFQIVINEIIPNILKIQHGMAGIVYPN